MDVDRGTGPRRGYVYVITDRNPNPSNTALDQGDVYLSVSSNNAASWSSALIPGQTPGKTQFFSMIEVDDNGWIHVAYYQNETGTVDGGVLNASTGNLYYTASVDGGASWITPAQINAPANTLNYTDPPSDLSAQAYYLLADYQSIRATGTGFGTKTYVAWTAYDKDIAVPARILCTTTVQPLPIGACCDSSAASSVCGETSLVDCNTVNPDIRWYDATPCTAILCCAADADCNGVDMDVCTCNRCMDGLCESSPIGYGNVNCSASQQPNLDDILYVLADFSDGPLPTHPSNDVAPACTGNLILNLDDILGVLASFGGADSCNCSG